MNTSTYWGAVNLASRSEKSWRYGQTCFNVLHSLKPEAADDIRGGRLDPFYWNDTDFTAPHWQDFCEYIRSVFDYG